MPTPSLIRRYRGLLVLVLLVLAAGVTLALKGRNPAPPTATAAPSSLVELAAGDLVVAQRRPLQRTVSLTGTLNPVVQVQITGPFEGRVASVAVRPGDKISAGELLAQYDESDLRARLEERTAALASAEEQLRVAERTRASNQALLAQNFISKNAYDNTLGGYAERRAAVDAQQAQLALVQRALRDARVISPFTGMVASRNVEPGQWVEANRKLFTLVDLRRLEIEASISSQKLALLHVGQRVSFRAEGFGDEVFSGQLTRINPSTQAGTRSLLAYVAVDNTSERLRVGVFVTGEIAVGTPEDVIRLPVSALARRKEGQGVWVVSDNRLHWRALDITPEGNDEIRVQRGLNGGEQVVVTPLKGASDGQAVRLHGA